MSYMHRTQKAGMLVFICLIFLHSSTSEAGGAFSKCGKHKKSYQTPHDSQVTSRSDCTSKEHCTSHLTEIEDPQDKAVSLPSNVEALPDTFSHENRFDYRSSVRSPFPSRYSQPDESRATTSKTTEKKQLVYVPPPTHPAHNPSQLKLEEKKPVEENLKSSSSDESLPLPPSKSQLDLLLPEYPLCMEEKKPETLFLTEDTQDNCALVVHYLEDKLKKLFLNNDSSDEQCLAMIKNTLDRTKDLNLTGSELFINDPIVTGKKDLITEKFLSERVELDPYYKAALLAFSSDNWIHKFALMLKHHCSAICRTPTDQPIYDIVCSQVAPCQYFVFTYQNTPYAIPSEFMIIFFSRILAYINAQMESQPTASFLSLIIFLDILSKEIKEDLPPPPPTPLSPPPTPPSPPPTPSLPME